MRTTIEKNKNQSNKCEHWRITKTSWMYCALSLYLSLSPSLSHNLVSFSPPFCVPLPSSSAICVDLSKPLLSAFFGSIQISFWWITRRVRLPVCVPFVYLFLLAISIESIRRFYFSWFLFSLFVNSSEMLSSLSSRKSSISRATLSLRSDKIGCTTKLRVLTLGALYSPKRTDRTE